MSLIAIENGILKLDDVVLPCVVTSVAVGGKVLMDSSSVEGASGQKTVFNGFDDSIIQLRVILLENEDGGQQRYHHLAQLNRAFKCLDGSQLKVYSVESVLFEALNIENVIFNSLDVSDDDSGDSIGVVISFQEWDAPIVREQIQAQAQAGLFATVLDGIEQATQVVQDVDESVNLLEDLLGDDEIRRFQGMGKL